MKVKAKLGNIRISPRKVRLVTDSVKGLDVNEAITQLEHTVKRTSDPMKKLIKSAIANAENNFGLDRDNLYVFDVQVGEGTKLKRWLPRAYGRASQLIKRSSHIFLTLEEREEGKNRKSKTQLEKERKERIEAREKMRKELEKEKEKETKVETKTEEEKIVTKGEQEKKVGKYGPKAGWMKKVFQRKSM
jgi:large subunit ribosomal protein L22